MIPRAGVEMMWWRGKRKTHSLAFAVNFKRVCGKWEDVTNRDDETFIPWTITLLLLLSVKKKSKKETRHKPGLSASLIFLFAFLNSAVNQPSIYLFIFLTKNVRLSFPSADPLLTYSICSKSIVLFRFVPHSCRVFGLFFFYCSIGDVLRWELLFSPNDTAV